MTINNKLILTNSVQVFGAGLFSLQSSSLTLAGAISGAGGITPSDGLQLTLSNSANSFTGPIVINGATLNVPSLAPAGQSSPIGAASSDPGNLIFGYGGALQFTGQGSFTDRGMTFTDSFSGGTITVASPTANLTLAGALVGAGLLNKGGPGTLTLSGSNTYTGGTQVSNGRLVVTGANGPGALPYNSDVYVYNGAEFNVSGNMTYVVVGSLVLNVGKMSVTGANNSVSVSNLATGAAGGMIDLSNSTNSSVFFSSGLSFATVPSIVIRGNSSWVGSSTAQISLDTLVDVPVEVQSPSTLTVNAPLIGDSFHGTGFRVTGGGTVYLTNTTNTANLTIAQGRLRVDDVTTNGSGALGTGTLTLDGGTLLYTGPTATLAKPISVLTGGGSIEVGTAATVLTAGGAIGEITGSGPLTKAGPGTLVLERGQLVHQPDDHRRHRPDGQRRRSRQRPDLTTAARSPSAPPARCVTRRRLQRPAQSRSTSAPSPWPAGPV